MGGQACVLYGAAEFSRDTDFAILASPANLARLRRALHDLQAEVIAVPPFDEKYLRKGHAIHFRCHHPEASGMRVDVMTKMRGVQPFAKLWSRRTSITLEDDSTCDVLSLPDLVQAKKTQRDKDWPMIRQLVEVDYFAHRDYPSQQHVHFWFLQLRTPELLVELANRRGAPPKRCVSERPLLRLVAPGHESDLSEALSKEEQSERDVDRRYWAPLRAELEQLRKLRIVKPRGSG